MPNAYVITQASGHSELYESLESTLDRLESLGLQKVSVNVYCARSENSLVEFVEGNPESLIMALGPACVVKVQFEDLVKDQGSEELLNLN